MFFVKNKFITWLQITTLMGLLAFQFNNCASKTEGGVFDGPSVVNIEEAGGPSDIFISPPGNISAKVGDYQVGGEDIISISGKCFPGDYADNYITLNWKFRGINGYLKSSIVSTCANSNDKSCYEAKVKCEHGRYYFALPLAEAETYFRNNLIKSGITKQDIEVNFQMTMIDKNGQSFSDKKYSTTGIGSLVYVQYYLPSQ